MRGLFIKGTDTGVGKTWLSSYIIRSSNAQGIRTGGYKPVCSGSRQSPSGQMMWDDVENLQAACGDDFPTDWICPQRFHAPLAPPVAAQLEGRQVDRDRLVTGLQPWVDVVDFLVVEGVGGFLCPLAENYLVADFAQVLDYPVVIVAANRLGVINQSLLTYESVQSRGLEVLSIVLNDPVAEQDDRSALSNQQEIAKWVSCPVERMSWGSGAVLARDRVICGLEWYTRTQG